MAVVVEEVGRDGGGARLLRDREGGGGRWWEAIAVVAPFREAVGVDGCVTLANCSNCQTVREERPAGTRRVVEQTCGGEGKWRKGGGGKTERGGSSSRGIS